jgi:serine/threonine-protein kinase
MADATAPTLEEAPSESLIIGATISGRYKVEALLGQGGMGAVYLVQHTLIRKRFALKMLHASTSQNPEMVLRFEREAVAAANVDHPNIAGATDFGRAESGGFFLVMEYLEGQRLRDALSSGPFPPRRALHIARQITGALGRSHELGIVHRDLKPENIMLVNRQGDRDFVKVLDFGLAKVVAATPELDAGDPGLALTKAGIIAGTPKYMAPEQCVGGQIDGRTDLYALGLILYEMLTGVHPFAGKTLVETIRHQLATPTPPMKKVAPAVHVPASLEAIVMRLTDKTQDGRYSNTTELLAALVDPAEGEGLLPPELSAEAPRPPPPVKIAGSVANDVSSADQPTIQETKTTLSQVQEAPREPPPPAPPTSHAEPAATPEAQKPAATLGSHDPADPLASLRPVATRVYTRLQSFVASLPPPLQRPIVLLAPVALLGILLLLLFRSGPGAETGSRSKQRMTKLGRPAALAPQAQFEQAVSLGSVALTNLGKQFPEDARVPRALAHTSMAQKEGLEAMRWFSKAAALDPQIVKEGELVQAVMMMSSSSEAVEEVIALLENALGEAGVDALYTLAVRPGPTQVKARFGQSLAKVSMRAHASASVAIAIDLRAARTCEAKRALLPRATLEGDGRSLQQLLSLLDVHNCGPYGIADCFSCLRQDASLQGAISAIEARTAVRK